MELCTKLLVIASVLGLASCSNSTRNLPETLLLGAGTSAYQIEGAWNISKSESIWDRLLHEHNPCLNTDCSNGDVAVNSYYEIDRNIKFIKALGLDFYRFSISWPRILPYGVVNYTNPEGIEYYDNLIDALISNDIIPIVTIYHWDIPQVLQDMGGFLNSHITEWAEDFAFVLFKHFGDRVKHWITFNEPKQICIFGYGGYAQSMLAPQVNMTGISDYTCVQNLLLAHANIYHLYDEEFRPTQNGTIGIVLSAEWYEAISDSEEDADAAEDSFLFEVDLYANPIFSEEGNWPARLIEVVANNSQEEGFRRSRLPAFTSEEIDYIKGTSDFFGLNYYTSLRVYRNSSLAGTYQRPSYNNDLNVAKIYWTDDWLTSWTISVPWGLTALLGRIREQYNNPTIYVTENGYTVVKELNVTDIEDTIRVAYIRDHLSAILDAIDKGSDVAFYTYWSLTDSWEWFGGYRSPFGLYEVDRLSENMTFSPRQSAYAYKHITTTRTIDYDYTSDMSIPIEDSP